MNSIDKKGLKRAFLLKAENRFKGLYEYSDSVYINKDTYINIRCKIHGIFVVKPGNFLIGKGCAKCNRQHKFIHKSKLIHGDRYNYDYVNYKNNDTLIDIICKVYGIFYQKPREHLGGNGCQKCGNENKGKNNPRHIHSRDSFITESILCHGDMYSYNKVIYIGSMIPVIITCDKHGNFYKEPYFHKNGSGCPICNISKGELKIYNFLMKKKVSFIREHRFSDCVTNLGNPCKFDFWIPSHNMIVEFDGAQHFDIAHYFNTNKNTNTNSMNNDVIKDKYCIRKGFNMIRIPYWDIDMVDHILEKVL